MPEQTQFWNAGGPGYLADASGSQITTWCNQAISTISLQPQRFPVGQMLLFLVVCF